MYEFNLYREVKDNYAGTETCFDQQGDMPDLLKAMIDTNPNVFKGSSCKLFNNCFILIFS